MYFKQNFFKKDSEMKSQIIQKNKLIEKLQLIINWYKEVTGIDPDEQFEFNDNIINCNLNNNNFINLNQKIIYLKENIHNLTEKKNYYKSKVMLYSY